jgi:hypothetical protein
VHTRTLEGGTVEHAVGTGVPVQYCMYDRCTNRTGAQRGWHASLGCFGDYLTQRGRGRYSFWIVDSSHIHSTIPPTTMTMA